MAAITLLRRQNIRHYNGKTIILPSWKGGDKGHGNLAVPDVYDNETIQNYPIGTKFLDADRIFYYGYNTTEDATATKANIGVFCAVVAKDSLTLTATAYAAGSTEIVIEDTAAAVNEYAGGLYMPRTNPYACFRVLENTVSDGEHVTLTLEHETMSATTASQGSNKLCGHPFSKVGCTWAAGRDDVSWLGVTLKDFATSKYQWYQTWGPALVVPYNEELGASAGARQAVFHIDGTSRLYVANYQIMGFAYPHTGTTATWFMMLQVLP
jgi:hypothetical protein